jgi:Ala-tRNA(Pro) deacylase
MITKTLKDYLDSQDVKYITTSHSPAFTASEVAQEAHVPGKQMAKVVIMRLEQELAMMVLPANYRINSGRMVQAMHTANLRLSNEGEFGHMFPDCALGAMPPFGALYGMKTYVARSLTEDIYLTFSAGTHSEVITMLTEDYLRLVNPEILSFTDRVLPMPVKDGFQVGPGASFAWPI